MTITSEWPNWSLPGAGVRVVSRVAGATVAALVLTAACGPSSKSNPPQGTEGGQADSVTGPVPASGVAPASRTASAKSVTLSALLDSLRRVPGEFSLSPASMWRFSGDPSVFVALFDYGDSAVARLVDCMDRSDPVIATLNGKPVVLGIMCATALQRIASASEHEDASDKWTGVIEPSATPVQLKAAKKAWQEVVARKAYRLQ